MSESNFFVKDNCWIDANELLPGKDEEVLFLIASDNDPYEYIIRTGCITYNGEFWIRTDLDDDKYLEFDGDELLYWMKLPKLPERLTNKKLIKQDLNK